MRRKMQLRVHCCLQDMLDHATDKDRNIVFLAESGWVLRNMIEANPEIKFHFTSEFKREMQENLAK